MKNSFQENRQAGTDSPSRLGVMSEMAIEGKEELPAAVLYNAQGSAPVVLACEHASNRFPEKYHNLGLDEAARNSHVAWDPGARCVAETVADLLDARLVESTVSRLVYDCNRPPDAPGAMPSKSECYDIPGNLDLSETQRDMRTQEVYEPFRKLLAETLKTPPVPKAIVTIHSFTPVYMGTARDVQIGVLHDSDSRLADAMLATASQHTGLSVERNDPYGPADGVTHTLKEHGVKNGLINVMLEFRNDLIATPQDQAKLALMLSDWLIDALEKVGVTLERNEMLPISALEAKCQNFS